jgi:molecular chaperone DnaK (HSP70)
VEPSSGLTDEEMVRILENAAKNREADAAEASGVILKIESERQMNFWETVINDIPISHRKKLKDAIKELKKTLKEDRYAEAAECKKNAEDIVGLFLDQIISDKLSKSPVKILPGV